MVFSVEGSVISARLEQPSKVLTPRLVSPSGRMTSVRSLQFLKQLWSNLRSSVSFDMSTFFRLLLSKAWMFTCVIFRE